MKIGRKEVKLPKRFKAKWIKALRSGKYVQGEGSLFNPSGNYDDSDTWCCLGVAGDICGISHMEMDSIGYISEENNFDLESVKKKGFPDQLFGGSSNKLVEKLAVYNDEPKSFKWIASFIERYL